MSAQLGVRSSSGLFPAVLKEADLKGDYVEDVYLLKPGNSMDRAAEFAVTRLSAPGKRKEGLAPIVMVHGLYRNRQQWIAGGQGLAMALINEGYDVWLPELREHGSSPLRQHVHPSEPQDIAECDLPAAAMFIREQTGVAAIWIGVDVGSLAALYSLQAGILSTRLISGLISIGGPCDNEAITLGKRITRVGLRTKMLQERAGDEPERRDWVNHWRKRFGLLTYWRGKPSEALKLFLSQPRQVLHIFGPESFALRLARWKNLPSVSIKLISDPHNDYVSARAWLSQEACVRLLVPALCQSIEELSAQK